MLEHWIATLAHQCWLSKLMGYDYTIEYKTGKENTAADALSRLHMGEFFVISSLTLIWIEQVREETKTLPYFQELRKRFKRGGLDSSKYFERDGFFGRKDNNVRSHLTLAKRAFLGVAFLSKRRTIRFPQHG